MESSIWKKAGRFLREQGKNKRWRKVLTVLGAIVVFVTAYVLLMPAVALERKDVCELEEHIHTEECYGQILTCNKVGAGDETEEPVTLELVCTFPDELHVHTRECYDAENNLICGYADYAVHTHTAACYENGILVCPLQEIEEHEHTDACYRINDSGYICGLEESEAHIHTDACYTEHRELICEKEVSEGHTHTDACYTEEWKLVCGLEDDPDHVHDEAECYELVRTLTCEEEESEGHQHDESCYQVVRELTCQKEENPNGHTHTEACRGVVKELVCGKEEVILHQHTVEDGCYEPVLNDKGEQRRDENGELLWTLVCDKLEVLEHVHEEACYQEHVHTDECYEIGLICGLEEHVHTEECRKGETVFYCAGRIHTHVDSCYDSAGELICGYGDFVIHTHDETCYDTKGTLICPLPEIEEHTHTEECYNEEGSLICQLPEVHLHTHTEECYDEEGVLICKKLEVHEHHHNEACYSQEAVQEEEQELYTKTCKGDGYVVTVSYRKDANIPEEATLVVEQITQEENEAHYAERQAQFQKTLKDEGASIRALLKIGFYLGEEEIEPESDVTVTVQLLDENGLAEGGPVTVVHFARDDAEILDGSNVKDSSTTFQIGSFSEIAIGYRTGEEESAGIPVSGTFEYEDDAFHITFDIEGNAQPLNKEEKLPIEEEEEREEPKEASAEEEGVEESEEAPEADKEDPFVFTVTPVKKNTDEYEAFLAYVEEGSKAEELVRMQVLSYTLTYEGVELDLTNCRVTVKVTAVPALQHQVENSIPEAVSYLREHEGTLIEAEEESPEEGVELQMLSEAEEESPEEEAELQMLTETEEESQEETKEDAAEPKEPMAAAGNETGLILTVMAQSDSDNEISELANLEYEENVLPESYSMEFDLEQPVFGMKAVSLANPSFTVQYYANLTVLNNKSSEGSVGLPLINTEGKQLPENGKGQSVKPNGNDIKYIYLDSSGKVLQTPMLTEVYQSRQYNYYDAPTLNYFNALIEKPHYELKQIWVSKENHTEDCYKENEEGERQLICDTSEHWDVYNYSSDIHFTNREVSGTAAPGGNSGYIYISQDAVIRLVYDVTTNSSDVSVSFYDYDITDGQIYTSSSDALNKKNGQATSNQTNTASWYANTVESGINSSGNYDGNGVKLAFGNANTGSGLEQNIWRENYINQYNRYSSGSYMGCAFGLVTGLDENGNIKYADGIIAPNLFNEGTAIGKTSYEDGQYSLQFERSGDTYTLAAVKKGATVVAGNLVNFSHPGTYNKIWTNHFWPMDTADSYGTDGHDLKFGNTGLTANRKHTNGTFPPSDDGMDHNSYFGMAYQVEFELSEDYVGPLEYYFYGDDDMWVFLDGELVCDIGGIHSSVGEYVNLWDYLTKGEEGTHTLSIFYTERGSSGSTCWMQFTLPSVSVKNLETTDEDYGQLRVSKRVAGTSSLDGTEVEWDSGDEFEFTIVLTDKDGNSLPDDYSYYKYDKDGNKVGSELILWDGGSFTLKNGEYIVVQFLPQGTKYTVTENNGATKYTETVDADGKMTTQPDGPSDYYYFTDIAIDGEVIGEKLTDEKEASGIIPNAKSSDVEYTNRVLMYELPESGGPGTGLYTMAGISLLLMAGLMYRKKFRERRAGSSRN